MKKNPDFGFMGPFIKLPNGEFMAVIELNESHECKQFHIRSDGSRAYEEVFDYVGPFNEEGRALVKKDREEFFINSKGKRVT